MADYIAAHLYASDNWDKLSSDRKCGCFYCLSIFDPREIVEWVPMENTALCPYCGVDSVIGAYSGYPKTKTF